MTDKAHASYPLVAPTSGDTVLGLQNGLTKRFAVGSLAAGVALADAGGAGLVGFDASESYAAGTVGDAIESKADLAGCTFTGDVLQEADHKTVWGSDTLPALAVTRHQWFAKNTLGDWYEALAVDDNGVADGNVVVVIPKFLSLGRTGTAGFIEIGPDLGAECIITGSGSPNFHSIHRVSKQANSGHKIGVHATGGHWEFSRSSDNYVANSEVLFKLNSSNIHELRKHSGANPTLRFIGTDGTTAEGDIWHDGNLRINAAVGRLLLSGAGGVSFGTFTGSADAPVTGSISIKDEDGNVRKLAVIA